MNGKVIAGGLGLALLASTAFAQDAPPPPPPMPDAGGPAVGGPPPPPDQMGERGPGMGPGGPRGHGPREGRGGPPPPPPPSKAAEFSFRQGPLEMRVRCSEYEPIKPCADAALTLMDKFGAVAATMPMPPLPPGAMPPPPPAGDMPAPPPAGEAPAPQPAPAQ